MIIKEVSPVKTLKTHAVKLKSGVTEIAVIGIINVTCSPTSFAEWFIWVYCLRNMLEIPSELLLNSPLFLTIASPNIVHYYLYVFILYKACNYVLTIMMFHFLSFGVFYDLIKDICFLCKDKD